MACYIVSYDLYKSGQNYDDLIEAIKSYGTWCKLQKSVWAIVTTQTSAAVRDNLNQYLDSNDKIFVAQMAREAAWAGYDQTVTDWLQKHL